jgi:hypothetical protein
MKTKTRDMLDEFKNIRGVEIDDSIEGSSKDTIWLIPSTNIDIREAKRRIENKIDKYFINTECTVNIIEDGPIEVEVKGKISP